LLVNASMRRWVSFIAALSVLVSVSCRASPRNFAIAESPAGPHQVAALGRLEPRDRLIDISVAGDERLARIVVKQGQFVKKGDVLGYLESYEVRAAARDRAVALLHDAEALLIANTERSHARIREADLRLAQIRQVSVSEIAAQLARIREIRADLDLALRELDRFRSLSQADLISRQQLDRQSSQVNRYRAAIEAEEATLHKMRTAAETNRQLAEAQVVTQRAELESVRASSRLASLREGVSLAEAEANKSIIRASSDGQIIEIVANPGESLQNRIVLRMGDVSQMYVLAEVYESDAARVYVGAHAEASSRALSSVLAGVVDRVGTNVFKRNVRGLDPQADADARVVQVRVRLDKSDEAARFVNLQVDVLIDTEK
jgi:HlyD family secretion protein